MLEDTCAWCNQGIDEEEYYGIAAYDNEGNITGYEYICCHCLSSWYW